MKHSSIVLFFLLVFFANVAVVQGGYSVEPYSLRTGPSDILGADSTISFFELPLWIQITWSICFLIAILGTIKFGPLLFGKVKTVLQNKNRTLLLEYIGTHPGCTIADLSKKTGINRGTARYHLYLLFLERKVVQKKYGKLSYLFANGGRPLEKKRVYGYIMNPAKQEILNLILDQPGISNKEIAERLLLKRNTVHWHLQQFLEENMIASRWDGRNMNYILLPEVEVILREYGN
ncbi:winged helix-turn-helix transcriptional regulator [Methanoregula sp.]|uniref:winged helix-turn-helix transcriptional regulator n=1 Tax=Methanoregula sp. TaxID=2052170 RepID=UPI003C74C221